MRIFRCASTFLSDQKNTIENQLHHQVSKFWKKEEEKYFLPKKLFNDVISRKFLICTNKAEVVIKRGFPIFNSDPIKRSAAVFLRWWRIKKTGKIRDKSKLFSRLLMKSRIWSQQGRMLLLQTQLWFWAWSTCSVKFAEFGAVQCRRY